MNTRRTAAAKGDGAYPARRSRLRVFSYATDVTKAAYLLGSARENGLEVDVVGMGERWSGWGQKLRAFHDYVRSLSPQDIVMCVDAYDIAFTADAPRILSSFARVSSPIVISAEKGCWPDEDIAKHFDTRCLHSYPNAGAYMGRVGQIRAMLDYFGQYPDYNCCDFEGHHYASTDDQRCLTTYYLRRRDICALDHRQALFSSLHLCTSDEFNLVSQHYVVNRGTGCRTCLLHGNSGDGGRLFARVVPRLYPDLGNAVNTHKASRLDETKGSS